MNNVQKSKALNNIECPYPEPFLLLTDGLYIRDFSHREDEYRFISNFLPIIDSVIEYDNGKSVEKNYLVKGFMVDGRSLPTVNVDSSELLTLNWVVSKWDASCIIGTQYGAREKLRYAMQTTTGNAKRRVQCGYTGWKKIDGRWNYLLPGHPSCEVILRGKLRSYLREDGATESDYAVLTGLLQVPVAPRELLYPTLALVFLSPLNEFLRRAEREPKFIPAIVGRTGSMKTSYAAFLLSFFGNFSSTDMPMSFRDTANSIIENSNALKDVLTCVDDYHPSTKGDEATMRSVMQVICRGYGDRAGRSRMNSQAQLMDASPPRGNAIITAESTPNIGESTTARLFFLEMNPNCLDLKLFSDVQKFASDGVFRRCLSAYTDWLADTFLANEKEFVTDLQRTYDRYRGECREQIGSKVHARVADTVACFRIGFDYYIRFLSFCFPTVDLEIYREEFEKVIMKLAEEQGNYTEQDRPTHLFIRKLMAMIECGEVWLMRPNMSGDPVSGCVGYESEEYYEIFFEQAFRQVMKFCEGQNVNFTVSPQALSKALAEEGIIQVKNGQNTYTKRYGGNVRRRVMCIKKSEVKNIYGE